MLNSSIAGKGQLAESACQCEDELRAVLDTVPDLIWLKDPDGIYLDCNPPFENFFGISRSDIIGKTDYDFLDRDLADYVRQQDAKAITADALVTNEEWLPFCKSNQIRQFETTKRVLRDASGRLIGVLGIGRDISERIERKKSDERLNQNEAGIKRVLDNAADSIIITDEQGHYQYVNEAAVRLLGYSRDELLSMRMGDLTASEDLAKVLLETKKFWSTGSARGELRLRHRNGESIPVEINSVVLPDGRAFFSHRDIRMRKQEEDERERHRETLVREVHHRIKNNLQGVAGLLQRELGKFLKLDPRLYAAISQINAIAIVHGLQTVHPDEGMRLCASVGDICRMVSELAQRPVGFQIENQQNTYGLFRVSHDDAVPVALVLNELILNAVKHSPKANIAPAVSLLGDGTGVKLLIRNTVTGTPKFNFDTGERLGTGLSLVRSLLPKQGAWLNYEFDPRSNCMLTTLHLTAPVVSGAAAQEMQQQEM